MGAEDSERDVEARTPSVGASGYERSIYLMGTIIEKLETAVLLGAFMKRGRKLRCFRLTMGVMLIAAPMPRPQMATRIPRSCAKNTSAMEAPARPRQAHVGQSSARCEVGALKSTYPGTEPCQGCTRESKSVHVIEATEGCDSPRQDTTGEERVVAVGSSRPDCRSNLEQRSTDEDGTTTVLGSESTLNESIDGGGKVEPGVRARNFVDGELPLGCDALEAGINEMSDDSSHHTTPYKIGEEQFLLPSRPVCGRTRVEVSGETRRLRREPKLTQRVLCIVRRFCIRCVRVFEVLTESLGMCWTYEERVRCA